MNTVNVFLCSSPLQVLHAHLVRKQYLWNAGDCLLFLEPPIDRRLIVPEFWQQVIMLESSRREIGGASGRIERNLNVMRQSIEFARYDSVHLLISDTFWLMNNVALAAFIRQSAKRNKEFWFSILDEGAALYTSAKLDVKRSFRSLARSVYLLAHRLPSVIICEENSDFRHALCRAAYCLHPALLTPTSNVVPSRIEPTGVPAIYAGVFDQPGLPSQSSVYVSQPLYGRIGLHRQFDLVLKACGWLKTQGIKHLFYKSHHFDSEEWRTVLETKCGLQPLPDASGLPIELWARTCNASVIFSHYSSALLNLRAYGFPGRVIAWGLEQVKGAFHESAQFMAYKALLDALGTIEQIEPAESGESLIDVIHGSSIAEEGS